MIGTTSETKGAFTWAWGYQPGEADGPTIVHAIRTQGDQLGIPSSRRPTSPAPPVSATSPAGLGGHLEDLHARSLRHLRTVTRATS